MPVTNFDYRTMPDVNSILGINNINSLLGDDEEDDTVPGHPHSSANDGGSLLHMDTNSEGFPLLRRRDGDNMLQPSSSSGALDLAMQQAADDSQTNGWPSN